MVSNWLGNDQEMVRKLSGNSLKRPGNGLKGSWKWSVIIPYKTHTLYFQTLVLHSCRFSGLEESLHLSQTSKIQKCEKTVLFQTLRIRKMRAKRVFATGRHSLVVKKITSAQVQSWFRFVQLVNCLAFHSWHISMLCFTNLQLWYLRVNWVLSRAIDHCKAELSHLSGALFSLGVQ